MRKKILSLLEAVQEFVDTNPNEFCNLAGSEVLVDALAEILGNDETPQAALAA